MTLEEQKKLLKGKKKIGRISLDKAILGEFAIHCETETEANILFKAFEKKSLKVGKYICDPNATMWSFFKEDTCYVVIGNQIFITSIKSEDSKNYYICKFSDVDLKKYININEMEC